MSKIFSPKPVFINNLENLKKIENSYTKFQYLQYKCNLCGKLHEKRLYLLKKDNYNFICRNCKTKQTNLKKYRVESTNQLQNVKEKKKSSCLEKYGTDNPMKLKAIAAKCNSWMKDEKRLKVRSQKIKQTCLKKYGVTNPTYIPGHNEKVKQTCLEKYGVESINQLQEVKEKKRETSLKRYGVPFPTQTKKVQEKCKQSLLKKYGVPYAGQSQEIQDKMKQTCLEKYGVEYFFQSKECREKANQTCLEKYGTIYPTQSSQIKEKAKQTFLRRYGITNPTYLPQTTSKKYTYQSQTFDSSWELAVWIWANDTGIDIKREPIYFEYPFGHEFHVYYPDFEIDGKLVEVKGPQFFKEDGTMQNPFDHSKDVLFEAKHQCGLQHGVEFWGEKEMKSILEYVKSKHGKDYLQGFKN